MGHHPDPHWRDIGSNPYFQTFKIVEFKAMNSLSPNRMSPGANNKGFSLIELAMVLVIVGILLTIGMSMIGPLTKRAKLMETRETVKAAKEAVLGYAVKNGYLPISTDPDPLGLAGARKLDAWGRNLQYTPAAALNGTGNACGTTTTTMTVQECTNAACTTFNTKSNVAFIVYSVGEDTNGVCTGVVSPFRVWMQGSGYNSPCIYAAVNPAFSYDDVAVYVSLDEIKAARGCSQSMAVTSPATLPQGEEDSFYSYSLQAIGGRPSYSWSIPTQPGSGLTMNASGLISGTINVNNVLPNTGELTACTGTINVTNATVSDSGGSPPFTFTGSIPVRPKPLAITNTEMPTAKVSTLYSATLSGAAGNSSTYTWTLTSGSLPPGLSLALGVISGTPTSSGTFSFTIQLSDPCPTTTSKRFTITVNP